jgi:hypothetical protein
LSIFKKYSNYEQNHGVSGVVYILTNPGLREGFLKIGCSRYSGKKRAEDLNLKANTGTPGTFKCIYEKKTQDCGRAEQEVFKVLATYRRGKKYQEFFEVSFDFAKKIIDEVCDVIDGRPLKIVNSASDTENKSKLLSREALGYFLIFAIGLAMLWGFLNFKSYTHNEPKNRFDDYVNNIKDKKNEFDPVNIVEEIENLKDKKDTFNPINIVDEVENSISNNHILSTDKEKITLEINKREHDANLAQCLDGRYPALCKHSILYGEEIELVRKREHDANLAQCLDGRYPALCKHSILYGEEIQRVKRSEYNANLKQCMDGRYPTLCNRALLNEKIE